MVSWEEVPDELGIHKVIDPVGAVHASAARAEAVQFPSKITTVSVNYNSQADYLDRLKQKHEQVQAVGAMSEVK